jgi:DNA-binding NtrC family response regulator
VTRPLEPSQPKRPTILVIDDASTVLSAIHDYFGAYGLRVDCAGDAATARQRLAHGRYAVVVADLHLAPEQLDPLELVGEIRERSPASRIVVFTGHGSPETRHRALGLGVFAFVQKPTPLSELLELVQLALMPLYRRR